MQSIPLSEVKQSASIHSYKDLIVWQKAMDLVVAVYELTEEFPRSELYGLMSQIRRVASSISANIAEGSRRKGPKDRVHFFVMAYGSGAELESHLELAKRLSLVSEESLKEIPALLDEVMKMLNRLTSV